MIVDIDNNYDKSHQKDHFFHDCFGAICSTINIKQSFPSYDEFVSHTIPKDLHDFLAGINPKENRYRWDLMQLLHFQIIIFLNTYGYDYQYTDNKKLNKLFKHKSIKLNLVEGFRRKLDLFKLTNQKEVIVFFKHVI